MNPRRYDAVFPEEIEDSKPSGHMAKKPVLGLDVIDDWSWDREEEMIREENKEINND